MHDWKKNTHFTATGQAAAGADGSYPYEVAGKPVKFWPISVDQFLRLRSFGTTLAKSISALAEKSDSDTGSAFKRVEQDGEVFMDNIQEPVSVDLAKLRHEIREKAVEDGFDALFNEDTLESFSLLIMDSIGNHNERGGIDLTGVSWQEFVADVPLPQFTELITGMAMANRGVFNPLLRAANLDMDQIRRSLTKLAGSKLTDPSGNDQSTTEQKQEQPKTETPPVAEPAPEEFPTTATPQQETNTGESS